MILIVVIGIIAGACGGGGSNATTTETPRSATGASQPPTTTTPVSTSVATTPASALTKTQPTATSLVTTIPAHIVEWHLELMAEAEPDDWLSNIPPDRAYELGQLICLTIDENPDWSILDVLDFATPPNAGEAEMLNAGLLAGTAIVDFCPENALVLTEE